MMLVKRVRKPCEMAEVFKSSTLWGAIAAGAAVIALLQTCSANRTNKALLDLQEDYVDLQQASASFDAELHGGDLVLRGDGASFSEPDRLYIVPIFSSASDLPIVGQEVELALNSGRSLPSELTITFSNIEERVCAYPKNAEICALPETRLDLLKVTFELNGKQDTDDVQYGS